MSMMNMTMILVSGMSKYKDISVLRIKTTFMKSRMAKIILWTASAVARRIWRALLRQVSQSEGGVRGIRIPMAVRHLGSLISAHGGIVGALDPLLGTQGDSIKKALTIYCESCCGARGIRTLDLLHAMQAL